LYEQERSGSAFSASLKLLHGSGIEIASLSLPSSSARAGVDVRVDGRPVAASTEGKNRIVFGRSVKLGAGSEIRVSMG
jgi:hypothetical protein